MWTQKNSCKLIHISTDYVYNEKFSNPIIEHNPSIPLNNYGKTKLSGDIACQKFNPNSIILRTSWLYSNFGNNFLKKIINLTKTCNELEIVNDQVGSPTYAGDLAIVILEIIFKKKWVSGIYHFSNSGEATWFKFANDIKSIYGFKTIIKPIISDKFYTKAKRPKFSVLDNSKIINAFNINQINYIESLKKCIKILQNES